jgi:hypothetical protein
MAWHSRRARHRRRDPWRRRDRDGRWYLRGERGRRRETLTGANELVEAVVTDVPYYIGDDVALRINGLGGTPISELSLFTGAHDQLGGGINVTT